MNTRTLGNTHLVVSELGLGGYPEHIERLSDR
jgi:hypothetical protein